MSNNRGNIIASSLLGLLFTGLTIFLVLYCDSRLIFFTSVEPPVNCWTVIHLFFGLALFLITYTLIKLRYGLVTVPLFILILWEIFEYKEYPNVWIRSLGNNIMDVLIGLIGALIGVYLMKRLSES